MAGYNIAEFFAKLSFTIDTKNLDAFEKNLRNIEHRIMELDKRLTGKFTQIQKGLASTQLARKRQLDIETKEYKLMNEKAKYGMKILGQKERDIKLGAKKAQQDKLNLGLLRTAQRFHTQRAKEEKQTLDKGMLFGPDRATMQHLRDSYQVAQERQQRAVELREVRQRAREQRLLHNETIKASRERVKAEKRILADQQRIAWRSRKRVTNVGIAEEMAYAAEARRNSWRMQGKGSNGFRLGMGAGIGGGLMSLGRGFIPGLGAAFALSGANRISQELIGQQIAMNAVTGSNANGKASMDWVKNLSQRLGLSYRDITPSYTKMLASGLGSGISEGDVRETFTGLSEYGRVLNLDPERMKLSMRAVEQMYNKQQVMSEELNARFAV